MTTTPDVWQGDSLSRGLIGGENQGPRPRRPRPIGGSSERDTRIQSRRELIVCLEATFAGGSADGFKIHKVRIDALASRLHPEMGSERLKVAM